MLVESFGGERGNHTMGLVVGSERAALIDTSWGIVGNLRAFVEEITDKPVTCLITHPHPDHLGASVQFDEIYMNPLDDSILTWALPVEKRISDANMRCAHNPPLLEAMKTEITDCSGFSYKALHDNDCFDLGGTRVRALSVPGHTAGSMAFHCEEDDVLFAGDAIGPSIMLIGEGPEPVVPLRDYRTALEKIDRATGEDVLIFNGHTTQTFEKAVLRDLIKACDIVLSGKGNQDTAFLPPFLRKKAAESTPHCEKVGSASMTYAEASLCDKKE